MPIVIVPTAYRGPTRGESEIPVRADSVLACLEAVEAQYPGFLSQILDGGGDVHKFVKLFVNEQQIGPRDLALPIADDARLEVLAAIAGG